MIYSLALTGPTASGKTALSIKLARELSAEIISCDSMQIYKDMNIGTAKATRAEMAEIPHHMIDFLSPKEDFSVESYRVGAVKAASDISLRGKIPLFVGGTGLYIDSVMRAPIKNVPESSREYRERMLESVRTEADVDALWQRLFEIDPESAEKIHKNNVRRVIRAIEIYEATGKTKSYFDRLSKQECNDMRVGMITLDFHNRENLYKRVDERVEMMMRQGLEDEVRALYGKGLLTENSTAAQAIGYKEIIDFINGGTKLEDAVELIKLSSRRYAKRQLTWFRHEEGAYRLYLDTEDGVMREFDSVFEELCRAAKELTEGFYK